MFAIVFNPLEPVGDQGGEMAPDLKKRGRFIQINAADLNVLVAGAAIDQADQISWVNPVFESQVDGKSGKAFFSAGMVLSSSLGLLMLLGCV